MPTTKRPAGETLFQAFVYATRIPVSNRRRSVRKPWISQVTLSWHTGSEEDNVEAAANDLSPQGVGLFTNKDVPTGTAVVTRFDSLPGHPRIGGVVRRAERFGSVYHIGVEFR